MVTRTGIVDGVRAFEAHLSPIFKAIFWLIFALSVGQFAFFAFWMLDQPIVDLWGFRPAQTAISVQYILSEGAWLLSVVPVFGAPWTLPLEFPAYQWAVAVLAWVSALPIDTSGRLISILFCGLCIFPIYSIAKATKLTNPRQITCLTVSFWLMSPVVIFWGRATLMETTVIFLSLMWLSFYVRFLSTKGVSNFVLCIAFGALAATVKLTAFAGFVVAGLFYTIFYIWNNRATITGHIAHLSLCFLTVLLSMASLLLWSHYTAEALATNPLSASIMLSNIPGWYFGSLADRLSPVLWDWVIRLRALPNMVGPLWVPIAIAAFVAGIATRNVTRLLAAVICFLTGYLIFPTLFTANIYYEIENVIFLSAALALAVHSLANNRHYFLASAFAVAITVSQGMALYTGFYAPYLMYDLHDHPYYKAGLALKDSTPPDAAIIGFGMGWGADVPYYAERRAVIVPNWAPAATINTMLFNERAAWLGGRTIGGVVDCTVFASQDIEPHLVPIRDRLVSEMSDKFVDIIGSVTPGAPNAARCRIYLPK